MNDWDETTMRKSVLAGFDGKPRTIFRGWQVPHNDGATQKYRVLSRNISEYSLLTHRRIEGSGSYSRMIRVSTATDDSFQVGFVTGRAGNFLRTIEEELLGVEAIA